MRVGRGLQGLLAFALLIAVVVATAWAQQPHGYRDADAPADVFSATRAFTTIDAIARQPHPVGTAEHDRVRDLLADQLRKLGAQTEIRTGVGRFPVGLLDDDPNIGLVHNIVGRFPGKDSTGTVYLVAHYDSVPSAPGANDDGAGVAAVLESVRALRAGGANALRNDLVVLLTDGEEPGLLGAEAFVASGDYDREHGVVINHEARGTGGPSLLWRLTRPEGGLIEAVAQAVPNPNTDSLTTAMAGDATSSNSDFTAFRPGGLRVLDWAYTGSSAYYHNRLDDPSHVHLPTLQQLGQNTLSQIHEFGNADLRDTADGSNPAFFPLPFGVLVVVPVWVIIALAVLLVLAVAWTIRQVRRTGEASLPRIALAALTAMLTVPFAMVVTFGWWALMQAIRPDYATGPVDPYRSGFFQAAVLFVSVTLLLAWYVFARRVFGSTAAPVGLLTGVAVIGAVFAAAAPAAAALLVVPACAAAVGVALAFVVPERWRLPLITVFLLPAAVFLGLSAWSGLQSGLATAPYLTAPVIVLLGGLLLLAPAHSWPPRRAWPIPLTAVAIVCALTAAGLAVDTFDAQHPRRTQLDYALDADKGQAQWISALAPDDWTRAFVTAADPDPKYTGLSDRVVSSGPAPVQQLSAPKAEILSDTTDSGQRTLRLRLTSPRGAPRVDLRWDADLTSLRVAGRAITPVPATGFHCYAVPAEGIEVELVAPAGPRTLRLADYSWLPDSHLDALPKLPDDHYYRQDSEAAVFSTLALP
ncbi:M28 family peptidase [Nocardia sp. CDC153]|uniref:M28 family peptidase n=1 Tax=Nocardia sp. CDC153 TaxID=3112167 RepID=UPI002DBA8911|nr:M28 family peptidase [Nocardia sp. CDC153]MEC3955180.1 M28 family peptidase [Nocardia sp. CDC153]